nr:hypothetical protein [Tanacetum cinerariifolium]
MGRSSFAQLLIEVNSEADLVDVVTIGIPSLIGNDFTKETIHVEYEWRPPRCDICKIFALVYDHCLKKEVSPPIVTTCNVVTPTVEKTNDGFQMVGKKKKRNGKSKSTNGGQFVGPLVKQNVRYEPKATNSEPNKVVTNVGNASKSSSMLKSAGTSSKKGNITTSNSYSALENEEEEDDEHVENVYNESANLFQNTKTCESSSFTPSIDKERRVENEREEERMRERTEKKESLVFPLSFLMAGRTPLQEEVGLFTCSPSNEGLILNGLIKDFAEFVRNYNMHDMGKTISELHAMLIEYEKGLPKKAETPQVMMIKSGKIQKVNKKSLKAKGKGKANGKGKDKQVHITKPKNPKHSANEHPVKYENCHHYKEAGHWKRNCSVYLAELLKKKKQVGSASSSGNGVRTQVEAIGSYDLVFPNGLVICLDNCHYAPSITRGVVLVHCLVENGFVQCFTDFRISVSKNNVHYFNDIPINGIYEIDMHDLVPNVNSIYNVTTKIAKHNLDSTYQWCRRLAHISKKRIEKLQQEGLLKSTDDESFDQCISCLSSKMKRKSFPHRLERATDLLGIIHTGVRGPLRHVSRQGDSYFITFTDDCSRYSYVYLLKHKHEETMGYCFYFPPENQIVVARYAELFEKNLIIQEVGGRVVHLEEIQDKDASPSKITSKIPMEIEGFEPPQEEVISIRRSERTHQAPNCLCLNIEVNEHSLGGLNEPIRYKAAMLDSESNKWIDAMNAEIQSMIENMVWVLVDLPPNCKTVGSKWIFKKKIDMDGIIHTYKARLVAKGYTQLYEVDYEETFSPITDIRAIRILISVAAFYDYEIWKMDVKTAFLNGYLDEDIYMVQLEGFIDPNHPRKASGSNVTFLILYVDDIIITGNHLPSLQSVKDYLGKCFAMKDLGEATFILRIKIYKDRSKQLIRLGQNAYMDKILKRYKMHNSKLGHILMQEKLDLNKKQGASTPKEVKRMQNVPYASAVVSIMYAVRCTRPDVMLAQNITSWFQQNPGELHWTVVKNILKFLRNTKDMFLVYGGNSKVKPRVDCYCDAGFETDGDDTKSQTGYVFILNGGAVD